MLNAGKLSKGLLFNEYVYKRTFALFWMFSWQKDSISYDTYFGTLWICPKCAQIEFTGNYAEFLVLSLFIYLFSFVQQKSVQEVYNKAETVPDFSIDLILLIGLHALRLI